MNLTETIAAIEPPDIAKYREMHKELQRRLPKSTRQLGRLADLLAQFSAIRGEIPKEATKKCAVICCADHGIAAEGVSAYPQETTLDMTSNYLVAKGGTANAMAAFASSDLYVLDLGIALPADHIAGLLHHRIANGTQNIAKGPAMTREQAIAAIETGIHFAESRVAEGYDCFLPGEMGIANTTSSAAIAAAICRLTPTEATGRGTNISDERLRHKVEVVQTILDVNAPDPEDGLDVLTKVGGFEFGCIAGIILGAAKAGAVIILDGFNTAAAALIAHATAPAVQGYLFPSHMSAEPAHRAILKKMQLEPLMDMSLRLSEGTGSSITAALLDDAIALYNADLTDAPNLMETVSIESIDVPSIHEARTRRPAPVSREAQEAAQLRLDNLAKPIYSLGYLESLTAKLAGVLGETQPPLDTARTLLVIGKEPPREERLLLPSVFASQTGAEFSVLTIEESGDIPGSYAAGFVRAKALAKKSPILALSFVQAMSDRHIKRLSDHLHDPASSAQLIEDPLALLERLPDSIAPLAAAMLGAIQGASEEKCLLILDDPFSALIASAATGAVPAIADHVYYPFPNLFLHATAPSVVACTGLTVLIAGLHAINDMKTFAEASVSVAADGPGAGRQVR
ncbi:hypothetical protein TAMA11512_04440 [Selenomonas sp. TAMA-11512]|uniref:nicotinate-nucleotide--dimethylbenzimidazole phosphoribosyltransferase n=1 Tax=Selenomonas sp. TAMA-11512 TaxID=3095337 RepID=UPI00308638A6|nr:hypothetical protein TAMA11512_04440 [Selenomonas sp. TAMA-11512]